MNRREAIQALMSLPATAVVTRAGVGPNDVVVIEADDILCEEAIRNIRHTVEQAWPGRKCFVLSKGLHLRIAKEMS